MWLRRGANIFSAILCVAAVTPALAADPAEDQFKKEIEGFLDKLGASTNGFVTWDGSDSFDFRQEGEAVLAVMTNARLSVHGPDTAHVVFDRIEMRRAPASDGSGAFSLAMVFPKQSTMTLGDGTETKLGLEDATADAIVEEPSGRVRETALAFASARLEHPATGDWMSFGPLSFSSKMIGAADGSWTTPIEFELKQVEFFLSEVPMGGAIDRIAYSASSSGPDVAALNRLRDRVDALRQQGEQPPAARLDALLELLPTIPALFSIVKGNATVENVAVRAASGEPLVGLGKITLGGAMTGLAGDSAAWRMTLRQEGLTMAAAIVDPSKVPQTVAIDFGFENVATGPLRTILEAAAKLRAGGSEQDTQQATQRMLGAAAMLNPVFKIFELGLRTKNVGLLASAQANGSPLSPKGYTAEGDVAVRGFDALPELLDNAPFAEYLPLLKVLGTAAADGDLKFRLASTPPKWITVNGNDVSGWFIDEHSGPGKPRQLRPTHPALEGDDVRAVQRALATAKLSVPQTGLYDGPTAAAVAMFQKRSGLNIDGVVDAATRDKLGIKPEQPRPARPN